MSEQTLMVAVCALLLAVGIGGAVATDDLPPCWPNCETVSHP